MIVGMVPEDIHIPITAPIIISILITTKDLFPPLNTIFIEAFNPCPLFSATNTKRNKQAIRV